MTSIPRRANRPHYHVWLMAAGNRAFFKAPRAFFTRQAARKWARRRQPDSSRYMVLACWDRKCQPAL